MEKKKLLDLISSYVSHLGFTKKIQDEDLINILRDNGYEQNEQWLVLLRHWGKIFEKVLENPLEIRRTKAINELINTGISKEDAINVINKIVGLATETSTKNEIDVVPNINKTVTTEKPEPELILQPIQNEKQEQPEIPNEGWVCKKCGKLVKGGKEECPYCIGRTFNRPQKIRQNKWFLIGIMIIFVAFVLLIGLLVDNLPSKAIIQESNNKITINPSVLDINPNTTQNPTIIEIQQIAESTNTKIVKSTPTKIAAFTKNNEFSTTNIPLPEMRYFEGLASIDIDNDLIDELAVLSNLDSTEYNGILSLYKWNGTGFIEIQQFKLGEGYPYGIKSCDINSDGFQDILVALNGLRLLMNNNGSFTDKGIVITEFFNDSFICEDINEDGLRDIVFGGPGYNSDLLKVYKQIANTYSKNLEFLYQNQLFGTIGNISVNSLNYDNFGFMEILSRELYSGDIFVYRNNGDFDFSTILFEYSIKDRVFGIETADFTNDGFEDFVVAKAWDKLHLFKNLNGNGFEIIPIGNSTGSFFSIIAYDLNKDFKLDIIAADFDGNVIWYENLGDSNFTEHLAVVNSNNNYGLTIGDFNGDGNEDIAFGKNPVIITFNALLSFENK